MKPIRHISPKTNNTFAKNIFQSPKKKHINIINIDKGRNLINNRNIGINNQFNFNYNKNDNYYAEITKAFNFITFVLKQKDIQIKELKSKINNLQKQLNDINESNIMTFYNQEVLDSSNQNSNLKFLNKKSNINYISPENNNKGKMRQIMNNLCSAQAEVNSINTTNSNNNSNNNIYIKNNFGNELNKNFGVDNNSINKINKINNSTNINKINNYRNIETGKMNSIINNTNNNKIYNFNKFSSENQNNQINLNINEHSPEKMNINPIRNESYHSNQNINIRNNNENIKTTKYVEAKTDTESLMGTEKIKILTFENSMYNSGKPGSRSNSFNMSDDGVITSKQDVKNYLKEVKNKLAPERFKRFITNIKLLTKNKNPSQNQRNEIILQIKNLLIDKNLINKFESIMKIKKN